MIRALLAKEVRALRPMVWCIGGLWLIMVILQLATELPDAQPFRPELWLSNSRETTFVVLFLFTLMTGAGLLVHESEQGTLRFLDGLPLSRTQLFVAKAAAALCVIAWVPALGLLSDLVFGEFSRTSLDGPLPWRFGWTMAGLQMVAGGYLLSLTMVVSFVRGWFALVAGLLFWSFLWLRQTGAHWLAYVDPYELLGPALKHGRVQVPWPQIGGHLGAATLFLTVAWLGFRHLGDDAQRLADRIDRHRVLRGLAAGLKLLGPLAWLGALIYLGEHDHHSQQDDSVTPVGESSFTRRETKRYEFLLRTVQKADAENLFLLADETYDKVISFLGVPAAPSRVVVDLASPVMPHMAGQTNWTKIRLPLGEGMDVPTQFRILRHETTHVFIEQLGEGRLSSHFSSIRCLHEGLATYVEESLTSSEEQKGRHRRAVAGAWSRGKVPFALLVDDSVLGKQREPNLVYPLGAELARALIETHGRSAPARFLHAVARPNAAPGVKGVDLWRDAMQAAGLNLERVAAAYETQCAEIAAAEKDFVATLPKLTAKVKVEGPDIVVRPQFSGDAPGKVVCLTEDDEPFGTGFQVLPRRADGAFTLSRARHLKDSLRYMLGWRTAGTEQPVFEPWAEAALK